MSKFWSAFVHDLHPYVPGEQPQHPRLVKLNTNEHPMGPSPAVLAAINAAANDSLKLYPEPSSLAVREAVASSYGLSADQVFVGNGSDEVLAHIFMGLFRQPKPLLFPDITYSFYTVYCGLYGIDYQQVPLDDSLSIDLADFRQPNGGIIFPNPNAPTGRLLPLADIEALLVDNTETVVVVDEAYIDFGGESAVALINRFPNLLVTQTLSKSRSLAGMRIGLAMGDAALIDGLTRIKDSFNSYPLDRLAQAAAVAAFNDVDGFEAGRQAVMRERQQLDAALAERGFESLPSAANFIFTRHPAHAGADLAAGLREQGVIVRHFKQPARIADYLRITVGTAEQHQALLDALDTLL